MKVLSVPQGSNAWLAARAGLTTASRIKDVMAVLKSGGESQARYNYKWELVAERMSGFTTEHYVSSDMERGTELEPIARAEYEVDTGNDVDQVGLVYHPTIESTAASPDGLIGNDGALELKVPRVTTHLKWIQGGEVPSEHQLQCLWVMTCCERQWIDFASFCPELPEGLRLFVVRMHRDAERVAQVEAEVIRFNAEIGCIVDELRKRVKAAPAPSPAPETMADWINEFARMTGDEGMTA